MTADAPTYEQVGREKRAQRDAKFIAEWLVPQSDLPENHIADVTLWIPKSGTLSAEEIEITESDALQILANVKAQVWTAREVTSAFCHRASVAHQLVNCLTEVFFEEALEEASALDDYQRQHGTVKGPLHGLPISLKDNLNVRGHATSLGMTNLCMNPLAMDEDSTLVLMLRAMGAVLYVKTNVPVAMMMPETTNHVWGTTMNPLNRKLSAGGSSGGEAALLALKGSPLGIGSDIGGSIRIPAAFQNLYAIRPTFGRFPTHGSRSALPGLESVNSVNGPMAMNLATLEHYCKAVVALEPWLCDPRAVEVPWRQVSLPSTLNFAVVIDDGWVRPTPPILRGVQLTIDKLKQAGHEVISWDPSEHLRLSQIISLFFTSDGGKNILTECRATGEPLFPYMHGYGDVSEMGVATLWGLHVERNALIKRFLDRWNATAQVTANGKPIDGIILPATPFAGSPNAKFHDYVGYTSPFNLLDYTVGTFPVTRADRSIDHKETRREFYCETDKKVWTDYDADESHGGAVALQLVGRKFQEEKVIQMLQAVTEALSG